MFEFKMPSMGADMDSATLVEWSVAPGDRVRAGDVVCEIETAKGNIDVEIWEGGVVTEILVQPGQKVPVGEVLARLDSADAPVPVASPPTPRLVTASPAAARRAAELGVDLAGLVGSGPEGAVKLDDVERAGAAAQPRPRATPVARKMAAAEGIDVERIEHTGPHDKATKADVERAVREAGAPTATPAGLRDAIAKAMARSKREIPHYYLAATFDVSRALAWMQEQNAARPLAERLVFGALVARAVALAARDVPEMNGHFDGEFRPSEAVHLGFAVAMRGGGVVAPALHDLGERSLDEAMAAIKDLVRRVRGGKLRSSEMTDSTITLTSLGDAGVDRVFGVIYPPQVAIVGFGTPRDIPFARDGMIGVHTCADVTLSADHRVSDGLSGARFLRRIERYLDHPDEL